MEGLPLFVVRIAISMTDALRVGDPLAQRLGGVLLREGLDVHFLGNRSYFKRLGDLFEEIAKFMFYGVSRQPCWAHVSDRYGKRGIHRTG